ncbi:MAG: glutamate--tRNA ligase [Lautropia sp.]|nr:glutamate--tRNA ligase [Lautropia sp.]
MVASSAGSSPSSSAPGAPAAAPAGRVRTRFAPSPTGFLHIGGVRTALYAWAYARHFGGDYVLRIEDTDVERSTPEAVAAILDGLSWLGLKEDEGPFYQMQRMDRYRAVLEQLLADGRAYPCYATPQELDEMREAQRIRGEKPRYDGRWRPENVVGKTPPAGVKPVLRFRNPDDGVVVWDDMVKGRISIANAELDDLVIARSDGTPTYNFCVVVDDLDMGITHVIRGDDHVNNTPRQINILRALGGREPIYGHLPMINGPDGQKLSKRHGAVSVLQYQEDGYLPEAIINYLARLGWSHGDDELFSRQQLIDWFDGTHLSVSPSQLDFDKFRWVNQQYLKAMPDIELAAEVGQRLRARGIEPVLAGQPVSAERLAAMCALWKDRSPTLVVLTDLVAAFFKPGLPGAESAVRHLGEAVQPALEEFVAGLDAVAGDKEGINALLKQVLKAHGLKMPQLAVPLRLLAFGVEQTPSVDAMLALLPVAEIKARVGRRAELVAASEKVPMGETGSGGTASSDAVGAVGIQDAVALPAATSAAGAVVETGAQGSPKGA